MQNDRIERIRQKLEAKGVPYQKKIDIQVIREFERKYGVVLPQELMDLYCGICNGCTMIDGFPLKSIEEWEVELDDIKKPFPFEQDWIWEDEENEDEAKLSQTLQGNIELIDVGDAQSWNVIVTGKQRGQMWFFTDVGIQPCNPPMNVLEWFAFWLDGKEDYFEGWKYDED